mmetsp:Transcript_15074/g.28576  ORF Transcript_15074/g.28576 Transcript_15074/m.28576 type:complete len:201 (+) Transcript_15074:462-1064(+)
MHEARGITLRVVFLPFSTCFFGTNPKFQAMITTSRNQTGWCEFLRIVRIHKGSHRSPTHGVDTQGRILQIIHRPCLIGLMFQNTDPSIGRGGGQDKSIFVWSKGQTIHRGLMQTTGVIQTSPFARTDLAVNHNRSIKRTRRQNGPKFRMRPRDLPHGALVALERGTNLVIAFPDIIYLDRAVRTARGHFGAIKIHLHIVN